MVANALACGQCGAGLPPPDLSGSSACVYCGAEHRSERSNAILSASLSERPRGQHIGEDAARIPLTEDAVLDLLRQHFADTDSVFVCPHVPPPKEQAARHAHVLDLPRGERILALYDRAGTGRGHEGFVVTTKRVYWRNAGEPVRSVAWRDLDPDQVYLDGHRLFLGDDGIVLPESELQDACANAFLVLALSGSPIAPIASGSFLTRDAISDFAYAHRRAPDVTRGTTSSEGSGHRRSATPPPPYTTSYFAYATHAQSQAPDCSCWHCHTPLYETTPQCAFCGAEPSPTGWLRTG